MARNRSLGERGRRAGFTLVETLAALAVAAAIIFGAAALVHHVALYFDHGALGVNEAERFALAMDRLSRDFGAASFVAGSAEKDERPSDRGSAPKDKGKRRRPSLSRAGRGASSSSPGAPSAPALRGRKRSLSRSSHCATA